MAVTISLKLQGQTAAGAAIQTKSVDICGDGFLRYLDVNSRPRAVQLRGDLSRFLREVFAGTAGLPTLFE